MTFFSASRQPPVIQHIERVSGIRPLTLLVASGIALTIAILIATGIAANHLRQQSLSATDRELGRIAGVLATAVDQSFDRAGGSLSSGEVRGLFASVPLDRGGTILLLGRDGSVLARFPEVIGATAQRATGTELDAVFGDRNATMIQHVAASGQEWRSEALRALPHHPAAIAISRDLNASLADWARQGIWFGAFALAAAAAIGIMVYLIARQFQTQDALSTAREGAFEAERARMAAEAELLKAERLSVLGQLTATVAHELRNPLSAIRNTLFTMKEMAGAAGLKLDRPVARMERSIERCDRIISDLLEYTRQRELNCTEVHFERWLGDLLAEMNVPAGMVLTHEFGGDDTVVSIDSDRIRRVIINLVDNAMQAMTDLPAEHEKRVTARTAVVDGDLVLSLEDTGPGMPADVLSRIFEPLFSTKSFGTGLGLPTVKQILNQHGGVIDIDSEVGKGTSVTVRIPLTVSSTPMREAA